MGHQMDLSVARPRPCVERWRIPPPVPPIPPVRVRLQGNICSAVSCLVSPTSVSKESNDSENLLTEARSYTQTSCWSSALQCHREQAGRPSWSDFRSQSSGFRSILYSLSSILPQVSGFRSILCPLSSLRFQVSGFRFQVSGFRSILYSLSSILPQVSGFRFQVSGFRIFVSIRGSPRPDRCLPRHSPPRLKSLYTRQALGSL